ncbi:hypothetical protein HYS84_02210 [Candidatus Saccharibacteria bacterium]|nr:hypothetical protein [Candidatus Saccharibacteria bacterium]
MLSPFLEMYRLHFAKTIAYMLQATEYQVGAYLKWLWRVKDFSQVARRKDLVKTRRASVLLSVVRAGMLGQFLAALIWGVVAIKRKDPAGLFAIDLLVSIPIVWSHLIVVPLVFARWLYVNPLSGFQVQRAEKIFIDHPAVKIAVAGSYGKTTMKEILLTVLGEGKKVAATPANKNVAISHAQFAKNLDGDEEVLIIEYGEGAPGDVVRFTENTHPNIGIITGLAPAHLDKYKTLQRAGEDIFSLADYLKNKNVYVNGECQAALPFVKRTHQSYSQRQAAGWKISEIKISLKGLSFTMKKDSKTLQLKSDLLGAHQVGPLAIAAVLADSFGLSKEGIETGVAKIKPFEHRMQPREIGGAWIIDDTYNGNIEGMYAGLKLLQALPAKRKIYVTPGLVDQGKDSSAIHRRLGEAVARAQPDLVVLMRHSVTDEIVDGIKAKNYKGQLVIEEDPLNFYMHLDQFVAAGDLVLLQNDWPDNYK